MLYRIMDKLEEEDRHITTISVDGETMGYLMNHPVIFQYYDIEKQMLLGKSLVVDEGQESSFIFK